MLCHHTASQGLVGAEGLANIRLRDGPRGMHFVCGVGPSAAAWLGGAVGLSVETDLHFPKEVKPSKYIILP